MTSYRVNTSRSGSSLLAVLFAVALISALVGVVFNVTTGHVRFAQRAVTRSTATAFGDAVLENLFDQWRQALVSVTNDTDRKLGLSTTSLAGLLVTPGAAEISRPPGIVLQSWEVVAATPLLLPTTDPSGRPVPENGTTSSLRVRLTYLATATVSFPGPAGNNTVTIQRAFARSGRNLFDNFFFGTQQNAEFHPGAPMYVNGTVYCSGDLYTAHNDLHLMKETTYTGQQFLNYRSSDSRSGTNPTIDDDGLGDNWDINNPPHRGQEQKLFDSPITSLDPNFLDDATSNDTDSDANQNNDGYHEIIEEAVGGTDPLQLDSNTSERLSKNADYRIYVDASNGVTVYKGQSNTPLAPGPELTAMLGAVNTNTAIKDAREADNVRVVSVDVGQIKTAVETAAIADNVGSSDGLLLYIADTSSGSSVPTKIVDSGTGAATVVTSARTRGVKLMNGALLPAVGLSVVSPNTVYIQGDYNTGRNGAVQPPSNTASSYTPPLDTPSSVATGYNRAPAAVAGDAVNILSNSWNDANSPLAKSSRVAANTTVNTAIIAGNVPTTTGSYSGGIENFVRLHEDWSGKYFTIYGAMAQLYASQQANHGWIGASYSAPNRRWYYDTNLQDKNPPGFRVARVYERGRRVLR